MTEENSSDVDRIVHLCAGQDWQAAQVKGQYRAASLDEARTILDGACFIHCSRPSQLLGVANRFYAGESGLVLLWIDATRLDSEVRWEEADGQVFPHIYGPINLQAVRGVQDFLPDADGVFRRLEMPD